MRSLQNNLIGLSLLGLLSVATLLLFPVAASARCSVHGYTIAYINGVLTTREQAQADVKALAERYFERVPSDPQNPVIFTLAYNPTHLAGAGDLAESISQVFGSPISNLDLHSMLHQLYRELDTRRVLLFGHSQGTFYANSIYDYFFMHGEPRQAVGVYNVATPASAVAGGGMYLNSKEDLVLAQATLSAKNAGLVPPLPGNIDIMTPGQKGAPAAFSGHAFVGTYLDGAADRIVADVQTSVARLQPIDGSENGECFTDPPHTWGESIEAGLFWVADPVANVIASTGSSATKACTQS